MKNIIQNCLYSTYQLKKIILITYFIFNTFLNLTAQENRSNDFLNYIQLKTKAIYVIAKWDVYQNIYEIPNYGAKIELYRGKKVPHFEILEVGLGISFLSIGGYNKFNVDIDSSKEGTYIVPCEMTTVLQSTIFMAKYSFNINLNLLHLALENGMGIAFTYERNDWKLKDPSDTSIDLDGDLERVTSIKPALDLGLKLSTPLKNNCTIGLNGGLLIFPVHIPVDRLTSYGPYKFESILEAGLDLKFYW